MVGDTAKIFIETIFRDDVIVNKEFKSFIENEIKIKMEKMIR